MAETPKIHIEFDAGGCPDCGRRKIDLPPALPDVGDDFPWNARDFDTIRQLMLEDLASRFPEKTRFTPADLEVVIVEVMAAVLDQISDMADRVALEGFLETARRPASVRRLLNFIGFDAVNEAKTDELLEEAFGESDAEKLENYWLKNPLEMDRARETGPKLVQINHRMVTEGDYRERMEDHPLVQLAHASASWNGSWLQIDVALVFVDSKMSLDGLLPKAGAKSELLVRYKEANVFTDREKYTAPDIDETPGVQNALTPRMLIRPFLDTYRMTSQEVRLRDAVPVGIVIIVSLVVHSNYHTSEVKTEAENLMTSKPAGLFAPGNFAFGEDIYANDFITALSAIPGVAEVCLIRFKRAGSQHPNQADSGRIPLYGLEVARCENDSKNPALGYSQVRVKGGKTS